ncbi:MAG: ATP-binding protein [Flavobacteriales bacterium]|nr:ATP-binding protein [Flavobacteriales bacterium]
MKKALLIKFDNNSLYTPAVLTDSVRLRQVLSNLISNAIKFTDQGSVKVSVQSAPEINKLRFDIEDSGIGMKEDELSSLLGPFNQMDSSASKRYQGTGLGLAISKNIVSLLGGSFKVDSEYGKGAFSFTINAEAVIDLKKEIEKKTNAPSSFEGINVLLVDDNNVNIIVCEAMIESLNCKVITATDGIQAIE